MKISKITGLPYDPAKVIYITNPKQHFAYARYFGGWQYFVDMDASSDKKDGVGVLCGKNAPKHKKQNPFGTNTCYKINLKGLIALWD